MIGAHDLAWTNECLPWILWWNEWLDSSCAEGGGFMGEELMQLLDAAMPEAGHSTDTDLWA